MFSHLPRLDVDNDISRQVGEELGDVKDPLGLSSELQETGDSWLRQATVSKVRSRSTQSKDDSEERASVTNAIQEDDKKSRQPTSAIYLKPTTMRGIPLASLTPSSVTRGFYVTKSDNDTSSTWAESSTSSYDSVEQHTDVTTIPGVSTTDEVVTGANHDQNRLESSTVDNANDIVYKEEDAHEAKFTTSASSVSSENTAHYEEPETTVSLVDDVALKRGKLLDQGTTSLPNAPVVSPTTSSRRAIALAVGRYNELTIPLWTGRRLVIKKRVRTTLSPIRDAIRRTEDGFLRSTTSLFEKEASVTSTTPSTLVTTQRFSAVPTNPVIFPKTAHENLAGSATETESLTTRATTEATVTLTSGSSIASTSTDSSVQDFTITIAQDPATLTTPASVTGDFPAATTASSEDETSFLDNTVIATDSTTVAADTTPASTTANYLAMEVESTSTAMTSTSHSVTAETSATEVTDLVITTFMPESAATNQPAIPDSTSVQEALGEPAITTETASTKTEDIFTVADYSVNTIPTTVQEEDPATTVPETTTWTPSTETASATVQEEYSTTIVRETISWVTPTDEVASTTESTMDTDPTSVMSTTADLVDEVTAGTSTTSTVTSTTADHSSIKSVLQIQTEAPVTSADSISTSSATTSTTSESPAHDINVGVEAPGVTETEESTTETATTLETSLSSSTTTTTTTVAIPKFLANTESETSPATTASFIQTETPATSTVPSTWTSLTSVPTANTATVALEKSTSSIPARATTIRPGLKTELEESVARPARNRTRGRTRSELAALGYAFGQRTSGRTVINRRVINRPSNEEVRTPTRQYPRRRITVYRGRPQRPIYSPSSSTIEENRRRRIVQKRLRASSEMIGDTNENVVDARNNTAGHNQVEDVRRRAKVVLKRVRERPEREEASVSPAEETLVLGESSNPAKVPGENEEYHKGGTVGRRRKIVLKRTKAQAGGDSKEEEADGDPLGASSPAQSIPHTSERLDEAEKMRRKMRVVLKRLKSRSEERNSTAKVARVDPGFSDQSHSRTLPTDLHATSSLADEGRTRRRMRVVLKSIRPVLKETSADPDVTYESLPSDSRSGAHTSKNLIGEKTSRIMRVVLKSVRPKPEEEENAGSEDPDSPIDDLEGNFSSNLYVSDGLADGKRKTTSEQPEESETEPITTEATSVRVEEDTDRPSHEVSAALNPESLDFPSAV